MKELLGFAVLIAIAYFFRNYQTFGEQNLRPLAVQWNYDREGDPQALCDLLAPDATVQINDDFPRFTLQFLGNKERGCQYFKDAARFFAKPYVEENGYIDDFLEDFTISNIDYLRGTADLEYTWVSTTDVRGLKGIKNGLSYVGKTKTKMTLSLRPFKDLAVTHYEFTRKFTATVN